MASIKEIAKKAGVSIGTIDRVLHGRGRVSDRTRARVQRIVADTGYSPNIYARNLSLSKVFRFAVLMPRPNQDSGFWRIALKGIDRAQREFEAAKVKVCYHHFDRYSDRSFERAFEKATGERPDGLLIAPVLSVVAQRLITSVEPVIPYVFFDSAIPGASVLSTISQDPFQSGLLAANLMKWMQCSGGSIAVVKVVPEDYHIGERLRGFEAGMSSVPSVRLVTYEADSHDGEAIFRRLAGTILGENTDLRGVYVSNAWTYPFAASLNSNPAGRRICIIGYDLVGKNREYLEAGKIDFLISQRPGMQGYEGIRTLYRHVVLREQVKKSIPMPLDILTKDNFKYYED
jgi:LacI family transcriptional regulator